MIDTGTPFCNGIGAPISLVAMSIGDRVRRARKKAGLTQKQLGDAVGVSQATISDLEKGESRSSAYLVQIAGVCTVDADWLATGKGDMEQKGGNVATHPAIHRSNVEGGPIPLKEGRIPVKGRAQLGTGGYFEAMDYSLEDGDGFLRIHSSDPDAFSLRVVGSSMMPRIRHNEFVVIEPNQQYVAGDDVVVCVNDGQCMIKVFVWLRDGQYRFDSINDDYEPVYLMEENVECVQYVGGIIKASRHEPS